MAVSASGFKSLFSEFASIADATATTWLTNAALFINATQWGDKADLAQYYLAAHMLKLNTDSESGGVNSGPVTSERLGPASRSYGVMAYKSVHDMLLTSTSYGNQYLWMLKTIFPHRYYGVNDA